MLLKCNGHLNPSCVMWGTIETSEQMHCMMWATIETSEQMQLRQPLHFYNVSKALYNTKSFRTYAKEQYMQYNNNTIHAKALYFPIPIVFPSFSPRICVYT